MAEHLDPAAEAAVELMFGNGGGASSDDLRRWQVSRAVLLRLLRRGTVIRVTRGRFRLAAADVGDVWARRRSEHLMMASSMVSGGGGLALRSSALAWDLPVARFPDRAELLRGSGSKGLVGCRVLRCRVADDEMVTVNGVRVTTMERTAVDLALDLPVPEALVTVDAALRRAASRQLMFEILERVGRRPDAERARTTLAWADPRSESALESRGRGELMLRGAPPPLCNVTMRLGEVEFRLDHWWPGLVMAGEADGAMKYVDGARGPRVLWEEKLRQEWLEDELNLPVLRYIDAEVRLSPDALYARFQRKAGRGAGATWKPPDGLVIVQKASPGSDAVPRQLDRNGEPV